MKINAHFRLLMPQHLSVVVLSLQLSTKHPYLMARASCGLLSPIRRVCACKVCDKSREFTGAEAPVKRPSRLV
jgi:hypothetical protein